MLDLLLLQQKSRRITKDVRARKGPECFTDHYMVKEKIIWLIRKRIKEDKSELGVEIKIRSPKYKLHLFHEENNKYSYKTWTQTYIRISYEGSVEERYRYLKENLHKEARDVLGEEIEVREEHRKQWYRDAELENIISKKKNLYIRRVATMSHTDRNKYNILQRKIKVEIRKAEIREWENKFSEL